jgi:large subunit ribosomal protein L24
MKTTVVKKFHIKKGDTVKVIAGDSKGRIGKVLHVDREKYRATVEGLNLVTKHIKPSNTNPNGGSIQKVEAPIHLSNLMLVNPADNVASRIGRKLNEANKLQRYSKKTGKFIK